MRTILVVEDEDSTSRMFQMVLERFGYRVLRVDSGLAALARLEAEPVDLVLSDVMIPGLSGIELCRRMRQDPRYATVPLIFISAVSPYHLDASCEYQAYIEKPVHVDSLLNTIASVLGPEQAA